ncbi:hypothetical protein [Actinophytocola sediminis]
MSAPYRPGQAPWPENQPQRPDRPPPIQFHDGPPAGGGNPALDWTLRIIGLVAVAVVSGFLWWFLNNESPADETTGLGGGPTTPPTTTGEFDFTLMIDKPIVDKDCPEHAYGQIKKFLAESDCARLVRAIYTADVDGRTVLTSVSVVEMAKESQAAELRELTDTDNTGNVNDLVREGEVPVEGLKTLSAGGGYDSEQNGKEVVIVESDYDPSAAAGGSSDELDKVCADALRLAVEMDAAVS